jgi:hypothetical protein
MPALRRIASALLILAAVLLGAVGVMFVAAALTLPSDTEPLYLAGIGAIALAVAAVLGWAARAAHRPISRNQLLLLALVAWVFTFVPATLLVGSSAGVVLNVLLGIVAGVALLAFLRRGHRTGSATAARAENS